MATLYDYPKYYDIAFGFRDIPAEVNLFEQACRRFARVKPRTVLELACGPSPHLEELARRGYRYIGLDRNRRMLSFSQAKARRIGANATFVRGDLAKFSLPCRVDFAFVLLGSLYVETTEQLLGHFDCVARALRPGGLYLLDWCLQFVPLRPHSDSWRCARDGVEVKTTYSDRPRTVLEHTVEETITLHVREQGRTKIIREHVVRRALLPQEFRLFVASRRQFEFLGWWNRWDLRQPITPATRRIKRPIVLLRRK